MSPSYPTPYNLWRNPHNSCNTHYLWHLFSCQPHLLPTPAATAFPACGPCWCRLPGHRAGDRGEGAETAGQGVHGPQAEGAGGFRQAVRQRRLFGGGRRTWRRGQLVQPIAPPPPLARHRRHGSGKPGRRDIHFWGGVWPGWCGSRGETSWGVRRSRCLGWDGRFPFGIMHSGLSFRE